MGDASDDKILHPIAGQPLFSHLWQRLREIPSPLTRVIVFRDESQKEKLLPITAESIDPILWVPGGAERQDSVYAGLQALPPQTRLVAIHDAARPLFPLSVLPELWGKASHCGAAVAAHRVVDTIKRVTSPNPLCTPVGVEDLPRHHLWAMETPQVFSYPKILSRYHVIIQSGCRITDDLGAWQHHGDPVHLVENPHPNPKITSPADFAILSALINEKEGTQESGAGIR